MLASWAICSIAVAALAWPAAVQASPEASSRVALAVQPVVPVSSPRPDATLLHSLAEGAGTWLHRVSQGRASIDSVTVRPALPAPSASCHDLAGVVAHARQGERATGPGRTLYVGQSTDCPYLGLAETPGRWLLVPALSGDATASARTVAHELGHTFGLQHAGAESCPILTDASAASRRPCTLDEYGDRTDTMGRGATDWGLGPLTLGQVGWGDGLVEASAAGRQVLDVKPLAAPGADGVSFVDPVSGDRFALAYRSPSEESDARVDPADPATGIYVYRLPRADEDQVGSVHLPWVSTLTRPMGGKPGYSFTTPSGGVTLRVESLTAGSARVSLRIDPTGSLVDRVGPVFAGGAPRVKGASVRIPRAVDQAGIRDYEVLVDGVVVRRVAPRAGNTSQTVALARRVMPGQSIAVRAVDRLGNTTRVVLAGR